MICSLVVSITLFLAAIYLKSYYRTHGSRGQSLVAFAILMAVWLGAVLAILFSVKRYVARNAPKCPSCHKPLTLREQPHVLASKNCPFCQTRIINEPGA